MSAFDERRYQVFVSSTFRDLKIERGKVLEAILEARAFPAGMELFPSADDEQWEFIQAEIESSDYYVVIVAGKYGSESEGISFTEREYDLAVTLKKPTLTFLFHDLNELTGKHLEDDPGKRGKLLAFREKVQKSKLVSYYANPDDLKAKVSVALNSSFHRKPQQGWVRAANARRIEDLELITQLQAKVNRLEAENRALIEQDANQLATGTEPVGWEVRLDGSKSPGAKFWWETTWDAVFSLIFSHKDKIFPHEAWVLLVPKVAESLSESGSAGPWNEELFDFGRAIEDIGIQFLGLGYITVEGELWCLTSKGYSRRAYLIGHKRAALTSAEPGA